MNLRSASRLRRTLPQTITTHRSPAKPSNKHQGHVQAPKSLSLARQLEIELRVEPFNERRACRQPPKRPLTGRQLTLQPPKRPSGRRPSRIRAPKNPSATHQPAFQLRGTAHRASGPRPASEETICRSSTRIPAPCEEHHQASKSPPSSEEPVSDSSTRI